MTIRLAPKDPVRDVLRAMTGKSPPRFVKGHNFKRLSEDQICQLQNWCSMNVPLWWLTSVGLMDAAESQVQEAVDNGNIPPEKE